MFAVEWNIKAKQRCGLGWIIFTSVQLSISFGYVKRGLLFAFSRNSALSRSYAKRWAVLKLYCNVVHGRQNLC